MGLRIVVQLAATAKRLEIIVAAINLSKNNLLPFLCAAVYLSETFY